MSVDKVSTTCRGIRALLRPRKRSISSHFETCGPIAHVGVPSPSLAPGLTTGRAMGAEVAAAAPAPVGTPGGGATVRVGVDRARAASGKGDHGWRRPGRLGTRIGSQLTGRVQRLVEQAGARLEVFGTSTSRPRGLKGCMRHTGGGCRSTRHGAAGRSRRERPRGMGTPTDGMPWRSPLFTGVKEEDLTR